MVTSCRDFQLPFEMKILRPEIPRNENAANSDSLRDNGRSVNNCRRTKLNQSVFFVDMPMRTRPQRSIGRKKSGRRCRGEKTRWQKHRGCKYGKFFMRSRKTLEWPDPNFPSELYASLHFLVSVHFQVLIGNIVIPLAFAVVFFNVQSMLDLWAFT